MRPPLWHPPVELSTAEHAIIKRIRRAKVFVFLRQYRHALFADAFQQELLRLYKDQPQGHPPVPPAQLALATLLQAYTRVSDDEVIEATTMDRRWQLVLDCHDAETPPFSKGTLVAFRQRLIAQHLDRRVLERAVELAATSGAFGPRQLRAALDSSPLWGAGRVEDTYNLLGHALRTAVGVTPANAPAASVTDAIEADVAAQQCTLRELPIDRASLASMLVQQRSETLTIFCKAWPVRQGPYFPKSAFQLDWEPYELRCPGGEIMPFTPGEVVKFPAATCASCALRDRCTSSASGRSVSFHPDEALLRELRERQCTPQGRAQLRERVAVEYALAHVGRWQGRRARYRGVRKNVFDLRRCAVVHNLHVLMHLPQTERPVRSMTRGLWGAWPEGCGASSLGTGAISPGPSIRRCGHKGWR